MGKKLCIITDCNTVIHARGYCNRHHLRFLKYGDPLFTKTHKNKYNCKIYRSEYNSWVSMISRTGNKSDIGFRLYGAKGILVCDRWIDSFDNFVDDMGKRPLGHSLDRIDSTGNYEPSNCRWSTSQLQAINRGIFRRNKSGHTGVSWDKHKSVWQANICVNKKQINLGRFKNYEEAVSARELAVSRYHKPLLKAALSV